MNWFEALILGIVQGLTEFLPVSSSGHLEIGQALLGTASEENLMFTVLLHVATVLSTIVVLRREIGHLFKGTFTTTRWNDDKQYVALLLLSCIPVFIVGVFFKDEVEQFFGSGLLLVGICLLVTACMLALSEYLTKRRALQTAANGSAVGHEVTWKDSLIIGCAQAVAVLPGLSRSGMTIATGLLCGVKKESVARFSFLMVLIPVLGDALLESLDLLLGKATAPAIGWLPLTIGFLAAFLTGCAACRWMLAIVRRQKLTYFAVYCLLVGILSIVYHFVA
ncbi:MAG: undecaprenyl-diphosphate phosphatase [Paludibacteraceae bacterium]|nr:undecaprenyl-diphosphate phosphatase [Paludibacteraceae bacterium]